MRVHLERMALGLLAVLGAMALGAGAFFLMKSGPEFFFGAVGLVMAYTFGYAIKELMNTSKENEENEQAEADWINRHNLSDKPKGRIWDEQV